MGSQNTNKIRFSPVLDQFLGNFFGLCVHQEDEFQPCKGGSCRRWVLQAEVDTLVSQSNIFLLPQQYQHHLCRQKQYLFCQKQSHWSLSCSPQKQLMPVALPHLLLQFHKQTLELKILYSYKQSNRHNEPTVIKRMKDHNTATAAHLLAHAQIEKQAHNTHTNACTRTYPVTFKDRRKK